MKKVLLALLSLTFIATASAQDRSRVSGTVRIGDGTNVIRIDVNSNNRSSNTNINRRVERLEMAVRQLQNRVYELEETTVDEEGSFNCSVTTCRESTSIHSASANNCRFFDMYATESVRVYAYTGVDAERKALAKLRSDADVKLIQESTLSCREQR